VASASIKPKDPLMFILTTRSAWANMWYAVSFRTRPNVTGCYDDNLPVGWYDRVFVHSIDDEFLRPQLVSVLAPGQSYYGYDGSGFRFASIDKATASAKLSFCTPAPPRVTLTKPAPFTNGTYPSLVLRGGSCAAGKTFRGALSVLVANPSAGCGVVHVPALTIGKLNEALHYVESVEGYAKHVHKAVPLAMLQACSTSI
jgi:hypothetical protein